MATTEDRLISEFNEAKYQILRLHYIWLQAKQHREAGKFNNVRWALDSAEIELWQDIQIIDEDISDKDKKYEKKIKDINDKIEENKNNPAEFYKNLQEKEKILRIAQEKAGKGAKRRTDDDESM